MQRGRAHGVVFALVLLWPWYGLARGETGFLVIGPDRGFVGNQEIGRLFDDFKKSYPRAALALVGRDYNGIGSEYSSYLSKAVEELKQVGASDLVAIPLFLSSNDPVLQKVRTSLPAYPGAHTLRWAAPMVESYLIGQILLDRLEAISREPEQERLVIIGAGVRDEAGEAALHHDLEKLLAPVTHRRQFKETKILMYYDPDVNGAEEKNKAVDTAIVQAAAKKGRTLVVLGTIGPKFDQSMALTTWIGQKLKELDVTYAGEELLPHSNVILWLKKTANQYLSASQDEIGVVIMPHGATLPWNDAVEQVIAPLKAMYRIEMAYGMGDSDVIQRAVSRLEQKGIRRIVFVRMYALSQHLKDRTDYILGLTSTLPAHDHDHPLPAQVRSGALFTTFGGYEEYLGISEILHDRIIEISEDPTTETVILLAHGEKTDEGNARWLSIMNRNIERLKQEPHCATLKRIMAATMREDWPEQREKAVAEVNQMIQEGAKSGRVLIIADRLYGAGPYKKLLGNLDYVMNEKGLVHPVITRWLEEELGRMSLVLAGTIENPELIARH